MILQELGAVVREVRTASGLSQGDLAALVGVSRATVNALESGSGDTVSSTVLAILDVLDIELTLQPRPSRNAVAQLDWAASSASTSFKRVLDVATLEAMVVAGKAPIEYLPHARHLTSELSDRRLLQLVRAVARRTGTSPKRVWRNLGLLAQQSASMHPRWRRAGVR